MKIHRNIFLMVLATVALAACGKSEAPVTTQPEQATQQDLLEEVRSIAKEAYMYANPMVDNYRVMYAYSVDTDNPEYKAPWNQIENVARVSTPDDRMIQAANSDTPYSFVALDLRTEPLVLTVPAMEENHYFSIQLSDMYTHIFGNIGTRSAGNGGGTYMIAGPDWVGGKPMGITTVIKSETQLALAIYRTQLIGPDDLDGVKAIQAGYKVQPLSAFFGTQAPEPAAAIDFIKPLTPEEIKQSPQVFNQLNWVLQFCPTHGSESELMERFAKIDIGVGKTFDPSQFSPEMLAAMGEGIKDAWAEFMAIKAKVETGEISSADLFGSRRQLQNNYSYRFAAAVLGIHGNEVEKGF